MIIKNGTIFDETGKFRQGMIRIEGSTVKEISWNEKYSFDMRSETTIDAQGLYVIPGLVDIHFHGCMGYDFCDGTQEAFNAIAKYQVKNGVTSISPATMTLSREALRKIFKAAGEYCKNQELYYNRSDKKLENRKNADEGNQNTCVSTICGITMEGPFVSLKKKGAQNGAFIHKPDVNFYKEMQELCGNRIKQVAVAPEEDNDFAFIEEISRETVISVAHTTADYAIADKAFESGASHVTHLFNAMPPFGHRDPSVVGAAFEHKNVFVELICDGIHIHPSVVRAMFAMFGAERICMISDSMMAAGMPDGKYSLGGQAVTVKDKAATLADGTIAGSASNLYDCFKAAVLNMGISLESAVLACTLTPAKSLGIDSVCGSISVGKNADLVLLDKNLNIVKIVKDGIIVK